MLSEEERQEIEREILRSGAKGASLEALRIIQKHRGWVSDEIHETAEILGMTPAELDGVATFYSLIFRRPVGKHVILVCDTVSCWVMGYEKILELSGIAMWVGALGILVQIFMMVGLNSIYARPAFSILFLNSFDPLNTTHKVSALLDFFGIWQTIVIGIGLHKWSNKGLAPAMAVSFVVWALTLGMMYLLGFAG